MAPQMALGPDYDRQSVWQDHFISQNNQISWLEKMGGEGVVTIVFVLTRDGLQVYIIVHTSKILQLYIMLSFGTKIIENIVAH